MSELALRVRCEVEEQGVKAKERFVEVIFEPDEYGFDHNRFVGRNGLDDSQTYFVWFRARQGETEYVCFIRENALTDCFGATLDEKHLLSTFEQNRSVIEEKARQRIMTGSITSARSISWSTGKEVWLRRSHFPDRADHLVLAARFIMAAQEQVLAVVPLLRRGDVAGVEEASKTAAKMTADAATRLRAAGLPGEAFDLGGYHGPMQPARDDLVDLALLDSTDVRALLDGVKALVPLAEKIDRERGRWPEGAPDTDTKGTDLAETLHLLACRLHLEAYGTNTSKE